MSLLTIPMTMLTPQEFQRLAQIEEESCVTLLMPTHRTGRETKQDRIRLKNLLTEAENRLIAQGRRAVEAREQLAPLRDLLPDGDFWHHQDEGLAICCTPQQTLVYQVPFSLPEQLMVARRCYLIPLIPIVGHDMQFYVLALSPKLVRLLEGTPHTSRELEFPGWPQDFEEYSRYLEEESQLQFHTKAPPTGPGGERAAVFHGQPAGQETAERKLRLLEYCRLIDERLHKALPDRNLPLVLACEERLASTYREASDYTNLVETAVKGNPDIEKPATLCKQAWKILEPRIEKTRDEAIARYHQAAQALLNSKLLGDILPAAHEGRIDTLFVAEGEKVWGKYDFQEQLLEVHEKPQPDNEELLNLATIVAYQNGASVHVLPAEKMPEKKPVVAILRY